MNWEKLALFVGLIADALSIYLAFKNDNENGITVQNYSVYIEQRRTEYRREYKNTSGSANSEDIIVVILSALGIIFSFSVGIYLYLILEGYLHFIIGFLMLIVVMRFKRLNYPISSYLFQIGIPIFIIITRFSFTEPTNQFFDSFSTLNLNTTKPFELGSNIGVVWNSLFSKILSDNMVEKMTFFVIVVVILVIGLCISSLLKNIVFPNRFKPMKIREFIACIFLLIFLMNINTSLVIDSVGLILNRALEFFKDFFKGFSSKTN